MEDDQNHDNQAENQAEDLTPEGEEPIFDFDEAAAEFEDAKPEAAEAAEAPDEAEGLRQQLAELDGRLKRTAADYQNYVRRSAREVLAAREQGKVELVRALITSLDHLDRAVAVDAGSTTAEEVQKGLSSTIEELGKAMASAGVVKLVPAPGDEFDPNVHEALMHTPAEGVEGGRVAATLMPGYLVGEVPVRPAQVSVAQ